MFVSYSRGQSDIADRLVDDLAARGFEPKIDRRDLPFGEEWQNELSEFIRGCDTVVWLASRDSVQSRWVNWELGEVQRRNKRLIPVRVDDIDPEGLPDLLGRIHFLPAEGLYHPELHLDLLVNALMTDRGWIRDHTRLGDRAFEWDARGRPDDRLLRGRALADAERWRDSRPRLAPAPGNETLDLILQSRRAATRRQQAWSIAATLSAAVMLAVSGLAVWQWREASAQKERAEIEADTANLQREVALGRLEMREQPVPALRRIANAARSNMEQAEKGRIAPLPEVHSAMSEAVDTGRELPHLRGFLGGGYNGVKAISELRNKDGRPLGRALVTMSDTVLVTDMKGRPLAAPAAAPDLGSAFSNAAVWLGADVNAGFAIASGEAAPEGRYNIAVTIYDAQGHTRLRLLSDTLHPFLSLAMVPDTNILLAGNSNGDLYRIDVSTGDTDRVLQGLGKPLTGILIAFYGDDLVLSYGTPVVATNSSPAGASGAKIGEAEMSRVRDALGKTELSVHAIGEEPGTEPPCVGAPDANGHSRDFVFTCEKTAGITLLDRSYSGEKQDLNVGKHIGLMDAVATAVTYSAELDAVAIGAQDGSVRVFDMDGQALTPVLRSPGAIAALSFMEGGRVLWSATSGREIRRWDMAGLGRASQADSEASGELLAVSEDNRLWFLIDDNYDEPDEIVLYDKRFAGPDKRLRRLPLPENTEPGTQQAAMTPSGSRVAWSQSGAIILLDTGSPEPPLNLSIPEERRVSFLRFDRTGRFLLAGLIAPNDFATSTGRTDQNVPPQVLRLYELPNAMPEWRLVKEWADERDAPVVAVAGLPGGPGGADETLPVFATGDTSGRIGLLAADGSTIHRGEPIFNSRGSRLSVRNMALAAQAKEIFVSLAVPQGTVTDAKESTVLRWSLVSRAPSGQPIDLPRLVNGVAIDPAGTHALVSGTFGPIADQLWDVKLYDIEGMRLIGAFASSAEAVEPRFLWLDGALNARALNRFGEELQKDMGLDALLASAETRLKAWETSDAYDRLLRKLDSGTPVPKAQSIEILTAAARISDDDGTAWVRLGNFLYNTRDGSGDGNAALAAYDRALEIDPFNVIYHMQRAKLRYRLGDFPGAEVDATRATQLPFTYMAVTRSGVGFETLNTSIRRNTIQLRANSVYEPAAFAAYALYRQEKWQDAANALTMLTKRHGGSARDYELLARSHAQLGQVEIATNHALEALTRLEGENGRYSALDMFDAQGNTAERRAMKSCEIASSVAKWIGNADLDAQRKRTWQAEWLRRARNTCLLAWQTRPADFPQAYQLLIVTQEALVALGIDEPLPGDIRLPADQEWPRLLARGSTADIMAFKEEFSGYPEAALAGRWLARAGASDEPRPQPDSIYGDWASGDTMVYRIEPDGEGGQIWRSRNPKDPASVFSDVIAETAPATAENWTQVGRHKWGSGEAATWGDDGQMVVDQTSDLTLFYAYLDSRYRGGWVLKRLR